VKGKWPLAVGGNLEKKKGGGPKINLGKWVKGPYERNSTSERLLLAVMENADRLRARRSIAAEKAEEKPMPRSTVHGGYADPEWFASS